MSAFLKVKILEKQGMSKEKALETVLEEVAKANHQMDFKLAECMNYLKPEDFEKVFPKDMYGPPEEIKHQEVAKGQMLSKMIMLATSAHYGQFDKSGLPYILHPLKVMHYLKTEDEELQCIAIGHDLLEDTRITEEIILARSSQRVLDGIKALTKYKGESQEEYEKRVLQSKDAMKVKLCDLRHNSDIRRLKGVEPKDLSRLDKYCKFYNKIKSVL